MPAGFPYFAWIDPSETTFTAGHMRWDEEIFSFTLAQEEGDPANLTVAVRRPRNGAGDPIGLLGPGRKIWAWFALDCGPALIKFRGRLVGIPTSLFEDLVTLEFVARPVDVVAQKEALAVTLRVLPFYDEAVIDPSKRTDPEVVLEGYTAIWHYDRETHVLTVSDEITGEDGLVTFDGGSEDGKVLYDGLGLTLTTGPLARVDVSAEYSWTQQARGNVDLTQYLTSNWPGANNGVITSFSLTADGWPKNGAGLGEGWEVANATATPRYDLAVNTLASTSNVSTKNPITGETFSLQYSTSRSYINQVPPDSLAFLTMLTTFQTSRTWEEHDPFGGDPDSVDMTSSSYNRSGVGAVMPLNYTAVTLVAGYKAERQFTERIAFSLFADVQNILTDPEDGEALRIDDIHSVNLSESIDGTILIGDVRRRSYLATERGNQSLEYLIALARAHLMKRARVVEIRFAPKLSRMPEITLRKNLFLVEPRVGEASGKIIGYSIALDGSDGRVKCEVRIGCLIGRGGLATATSGTPTYCSISYTGSDYQQFIERTVLVDAFADSSVGYVPPNAEPNDDGMNFLSGLRPETVIEVGLVVENPPAVQRAHLLAMDSFPTVAVGSGQLPKDIEQHLAQEAVAARAEGINNALKEVETRATFKLKSMTREFATDYAVQVTDLKIPTGYDLEAV